MGIDIQIKDNVHPEAKKVDEANERHERHGESEMEYIGRDVAKSIWGHYREKTIDLGGRNGR